MDFVKRISVRLWQCGRKFYNLVSPEVQSRFKPFISKEILEIIQKHFSKIPLVGLCARFICRPISLALRSPPERSPPEQSLSVIQENENYLAIFKKYWFQIILMFPFVGFLIFYYYKKPKAIENFGGLKNDSNFCYMNSMIQALASSEKLLENLVQIKNNIGNKNYKQLKIFIDLLQTINESGSSINNNTKKLDLLMTLVNWTKSDQQDAYDLLSFLLNSVEKSIESHEMILMPLKLELIHTFTGINIPNKVQFHLGLSIGLCGKYNERSGETLNYLIEQYFAPTLIDDDPEKTSKLLFFKNPPNLLLLHIQANKWNSEKGEMVKPEYYIKYEEVIRFDAPIYTENSKLETLEVQYHLTAIVHHMGNISGGHYITYRKWKGNWYLVNDEQVSSVDFKCEICPYILLYEKS